MGIHGLWPILEPTGRPIALETLEGKYLAVDVSLWGVSGKLGHSFAVRCGHVAILVDRMCKLLYYKIRPVFVFDGPGVPHFKKRVQRERRLRRHLDELALTQRGKRHLEELFLSGTQTQEALEDIAKDLVVPPRKAIRAADANLFDLPSTSIDYFPPPPNFLEDVEEDVSDEDCIDITDETEIETIERLVETRENIRKSRLRPMQIPKDSNEFSQFQLKRIVQRGVLNAEIDKKVKDLTGQYGKQAAVKDEEIEIIENPKPASQEYGSVKLTLDLFMQTGASNSLLPKPEENSGGEEKTKKLLSSQEILTNLTKEERRSFDSLDDDEAEFVSKSAIVEAIVKKRQSKEAAAYAHEDDWSSSGSSDDNFVDVDDAEMLKQLNEKIQKETEALSQLKRGKEAEDNEKEEGGSSGGREEWDPMKNFSTDRPSTSGMGISLEDQMERDVLQQESKIQKELQEFLTACGFPWVEAPGEAEAQCVELERLGLVQGVISDDSDVWAFGARHVYRNLFSRKKHAQHFEAAKIERELGLSQIECIAVAIISGGDYSPGLRKIGMVTALELVAQFAERRTAESPTLEQVQEKVTRLLTKIRDWLMDVNKLEPTIVLRKLREAVEKSNGKEQIEALTNPDVIAAYVYPNVNRSTERFRWGKVDMVQLQKLLFIQLGWDERRFKSNVADAFGRWNDYISGVTSYQTHITSYAYTIEKDPKEMRIDHSQRVRDALTRLANKTNVRVDPTSSASAAPSLICQARLVDEGTATTSASRKPERAQKRAGTVTKGCGKKKAKIPVKKQPISLNLSESSSEEETNDKDADYRP